MRLRPSCPRPTLAPAALLLSAALLSSGCARPAGPEGRRLEEAVDSLPVHLYLAAKAAAGPGGLPPAPAAPAVAQADSPPAEVPPAEVQPAAGREGGGEVTLARVAAASLRAMEGTVHSTAARGRAVLVADREGRQPPLLPALLERAQLAPELRASLDAPTEHAVLLVALSSLKLHPTLPVPLPGEVLLYEAWRTEPERVRIPGFTQQLRALKAYTFAREGYCDLAEVEAGRLEQQAAPQGAPPDAGLRLIGARPRDEEAPLLTPAQREHLEALTRTLTSGTVALCHTARGAAQEGGEALTRLLDDCERRGIDAPELQLLRAHAECTGGKPARGKARLAALAPRKDLTPEAREDLALLEQHCGGGDAGALAPVVSSARVASAVARAAGAHLEASGAPSLLARAGWVREVQDFGRRVGGALAVPELLTPRTDGTWRARVRGWVDGLRPAPAPAPAGREG
jgi:hypothetical protein